MDERNDVRVFQSGHQLGLLQRHVLLLGRGPTELHLLEHVLSQVRQISGGPAETHTPDRDTNDRDEDEDKGEGGWSIGCTLDW